MTHALLVVLGLLSLLAAFSPFPLGFIGPIFVCGFILVAAAIDRGFRALGGKVDALRESQEKTDIYKAIQEFRKSKREMSADNPS